MKKEENEKCTARRGAETNCKSASVAKNAMVQLERILTHLSFFQGVSAMQTFYVKSKP